MRRALIGTPAHDGRVDVYYAHALAQTARLCQRAGIEQREILMEGDALVQKARNDIVRLALQNGFDDLIFIDSDQDWNPEWVLKLLSYPVDCVGAAVRKKTDAEELYNVKSDTFHIPVEIKTGLMVVQALGTGFIRFSRRALQVLWDSSEEYAVYGEKSRWIFDVRPFQGTLISEDTMVSMKLREHGIMVHLDPAMTCGHIGRKRYAGDFAAWLKRAQEQHPQQEKQAAGFNAVQGNFS